MNKMLRLITRELRYALKAGDTLQTIARKADVSLQTLYNWLDGTVANPHSRTLIKVSDALGLDWSLLRRNER